MEWNWKQNLSKEIFEKKYMINGEKSIEEVFKLIAEDLSSKEDEDDNGRIKWKEAFYQELISGRLIPGGRIAANSRPDSKNRYYNNCYTIEVNDSMDDIYKAVHADALISATGGGVGFNISKLRPEGTITSNGGISSGPISFLKVFNESAKIIQTGGHRRCLPLWYEVLTPDGAKKITDLIIGDLIIFDGKNFKINGVYFNNKQSLVKIITKNGFHVSTPNHRWYVYDIKNNKYSWVEAKDLYKQGENPRYAFLTS
jgi:ribonucleotide reductase alpha subunit